MLKRMKNITIPLLIVLFVFGVYASGYYWLREHTQIGLGNALQSVLNTSHQAITSWSASRKASAAIWADNSQIRSLTQELLALSLEPDTLRSAPAQKELRTLLAPVLAANGYQGYFIIAPDRTNLASSRDSNLGLKNLLILREDALSALDAGDNFISLPQRSDVPLPDLANELHSGLPTMFVGAPIHQQDGKIIAVLTFRIDPLQDFTRILDRGRIGLSGETYAFDQSGLLISSTRFDDELYKSGLLDYGQKGMLNIRIANPKTNITNIKDKSYRLPATPLPLTRMASSAIVGQRGMDLEGYNDYRGVSVIGTWLWDDELRMGLATEIDTAHAYRLLHLQRVNGTIVSTLVAILFIALYLIAQRNRKQLSDSETRHRLAIRGLQTGIYDWDVIQDRIYLSPFLRRMTGYSDTELPDDVSCWNELIHPDDSQRAAKWQEQLLEGKDEYFSTEYRLRHHDGHYIQILSKGFVSRQNGKASHIIATVENVTEQNQIREQLRKTQFTLDHQSESVIWFSNTGRILYVNQAAEQLLGYEFQELKHKSIVDLDLQMTEDDFPEFLNQLSQQGILRLDTRTLTKEGNKIPVAVALNYFEFEGSSFICALVHNISEQLATARQLKESQRRLVFALQASSDGLFDWDLQTDELYFSRHWKAMLGYKEDEIDNCPKEWTSRIYTDDQFQVLEQIQALVGGEKQKIRIEYRLRHQEGHYLDIMTRALAVSDEQGEVYRIVGTNTDMSERQQLLRNLADRVNFEHFLAKTSASFINLPQEQLTSTVNSTLVAACQLMGLDRSFVIDCHKGCESCIFKDVSNVAKRRQDNTDPTKRGCTIVNFLQGRGKVQTISIPDVIALPEPQHEVQAAFQQLGIQGITFEPLQAANQVVGWLAFATTGQPQPWSEQLLAWQKLLAGIVANAIVRVRAEREIQALSEKAREENVYLREEIQITQKFDQIIGDSQSIKRLLKNVAQVAPTNSSVLILGESGSGKELIAHAIHDHSSRKEQAFIKLNCAVLASSLLESELFGHEKGAFTGADRKRQGRFELADEGTLFLDEIGELDVELQAKLLRVLQEGEFERVGGSKTHKVNIRLVAATNRNLEQEVKNGRFREDLYYRLNVFPLEVPPLRKRAEDIPALVAYFLEHFNQELGKDITEIPQSVMDKLEQYQWPGNIRELRNVIERAVIVSPANQLQLQQGTLAEEQPEAQVMDNKSLVEVEKEHIIKVLQQHNWRVSGNKGAALSLDINPATLRSRMKKLGIERPAD